jgi:peroxiredoxin
MKKYLILTVIAVVGALATMGFGPAESGYKAGDVARDFRLKNVDGKMVSLADYKDARGYIVTFTCNHCPFAKMYESRIEALDHEFAGKGYPVIAISPSDPEVVPDDSYDKMVELAKAHHYTFPYLFDETQEISRAYGATNTPHVFVLNKEDGKLVVRYIGAIDDNAQDAKAAKTHYVADAVNALLTGKPVPTAKTKAIGCGIKWKNS